MSKERLEEMKEILLQAIGSHQSLDHKLHLMEDVQNVFKQAERVEELEKLCKQLIGEEWMNDEGLYDSEMMKLEKENQRYKQALEEIVEYNTSKFPHASVSYLENIANQALAGDNS